MNSFNNAEKLRSLLRLARLYALDQVPYFGRALVAFRHYLAYNVGTVVAYVPPLSAYWDVERLSALTAQDRREAIAQIAYGHVHAVCHFLREHVERQGKRLCWCWHLACDLEINDWVPPGLTRPKDCARASPHQCGLPEGRSAEWYYEHLLRMVGGHRRGRSGSGSLKNLERELERGADRFFDRFGLPPTAQVLDDRGAAGVEDGSLEDDSRTQRGLARTAGGKRADVADEDDKELMEHLRRSVASALLAEKARGTVPAGALRWAEEYCKPVVRWQDRLRRAVRARLTLGSESRIDFSFTRPHRKSAAYAPLVLPRLAGRVVPRVACVVDTSGSVSPRELGQAVAEIGGLLLQSAGPVVIIPCDAAAYDPIVVRSPQDLETLKNNLRGGGGTDMREGIHAALALKPPPTLVVVFTDGYTPLPESRPKDTDLLWVIWHDAQLGPEGVKAFAERLLMPPWRQQDFVFVPVQTDHGMVVLY